MKNRCNYNSIKVIKRRRCPVFQGLGFHLGREAAT
jgi:hypothetical protein